MEKMPASRSDYLKTYGGAMFNEPSENYEIKISGGEATELYPSEVWQVGLPVIAKYNDYGGFELQEHHSGQIALQLLVNYTKKHALELSQENVKYARIHFKPQDLKGDGQSADIEKILQAQQENMLFFGSESIMPGGQYSPDNYNQVTFTYMDKRVYDLILGEMASYRQDLHQKIDNHFGFIEDFIKAKNELYKTDHNAPEFKDKALAMHELEAKVKLSDINASYTNSLQCFYPQKYFEFDSYITIDKDTKQVSWDTKKKENYTKLLKAKADMVVVNDYMSNVLHESWTPVKYTGQKISNKQKINFNKAVNKIAKEKYDETFGEDKPRRKKKTI